MGRRSINTTKSGKYMNPTDQARKEARKRELKKNKKQRQLVRTAVLKGKDPIAVLLELQKIDEMQYNALTPPPLSEKVLKDKRKKLHDTWNRLKGLYYREDPEKLKELKKLETDYISNRDQMIKFYESVKITQNVVLDDIPLPAAPNTSQLSEGGFLTTSSGQIIPPPSILKKVPIPYCFQSKDLDSKTKIPGVPPGMPPPLSDDEDSEAEFVKPTALMNEEEEKRNKKRKIRFADEETSSKSTTSSIQAKMMAMAGQDITDFLKEVEAVQKQNTSLPPADDIPLPGVQEMPLPIIEEPSIVPPPPLMFRPPPPQVMQMPTRPMRPIMRPPVGIPPGLPPRMLRPPMIQAPPAMGPPPTNTSIPPPSMPKKTKFTEDGHSATIEAKPQLRALNAELMRFLPTTLRVKREDKTRKHLGKHDPNADNTSGGGPAENTKDQAYQLFLKEMENLL